MKNEPTFYSISNCQKETERVCLMEGGTFSLRDDFWTHLPQDAQGLYSNFQTQRNNHKANEMLSFVFARSL